MQRNKALMHREREPGMNEGKLQKNGWISRLTWEAKAKAILKLLIIVHCSPTIIRHHKYIYLIKLVVRNLVVSYSSPLNNAKDVQLFPYNCLNPKVCNIYFFMKFVPSVFSWMSFNIATLMFNKKITYNDAYGWMHSQFCIMMLRYWLEKCVSWWLV